MSYENQLIREATEGPTWQEVHEDYCLEESTPEANMPRIEMKQQGNPLENARTREKLIAEGLRVVAARHNVTLRDPLHIDSRGEYAIIAIEQGKRGCGQFGTFADVLNAHNPRTGMYYGVNILMPENGWCYLNHFDAERLVNAASNLNKSDANTATRETQ